MAVGGLAAGTESERAFARPDLGPAVVLPASAGIGGREVAAAFTRRSYVARSRATVRIWARARELTFTVFLVGPGESRHRFHGTPVTEPRARRWSGSPRPRSVRIRVGRWGSGLYVLRLSTRDGRVGHAPFVVRPRRVPRPAPFAVVLPTNTWQAYNFRDMDGDGLGDTWYADPSVRVVNLARPYLRPGMPAHFRTAYLPFIRWLYRHERRAHFYADDDLGRFPSGRWLARRYRLVVFAGHEEYVSRSAYDLAESYRNRGGNLAFLSANNVFYRVRRQGNLLHGRTRWRDPRAARGGARRGPVRRLVAAAPSPASLRRPRRPPRPLALPRDGPPQRRPVRPVGRRDRRPRAVLPRRRRCSRRHGTSSARARRRR